METNFNFKSSVCTSKEQSERLLALGLKKETADMMHYAYIYAAGGCFIEEHLRKYHIRVKRDNVWEEIGNEHRIPAWSLHRLLCLIPKEVNIDGYRFPLRSDALMRLDEADDMYEYIIGVLERTIKEGYFNKEYLV